MSYDPDERRDTPLARKLKERIGHEGPITVGQYMQACLQDPEHGYYRGRQAIGAGGDFITAPEISQIFGELIGLWCAVVWQQMGAPAKVSLVELGPGRGTLLSDALRAARIAPGFREALALHLVESNETLREAQRAALGGAGIPIVFHETLSDWSAHSEPRDVPAIVIGNEFLDALPIEQYEFRASAWRMREIAVEDGRLSFASDLGPAAEPMSPAGLEPREGDIIEVCAAHRTCAEALAATSARAAAALFIDYGHGTTAFGETLQGIARQAFVSPFCAPGEIDLSAQVDFAHFAQACRGAGLETDGPISQAEFLGSPGISERASKLMAANPTKAAAIEAGVARLMAPTGMGTRFKALGVHSPGLPPLPGFASAANSG